MLSLSIAVSIFQMESPEVHASTPQFLNVSILPSGPVTLSVGQVQVFSASCSNVSFAPFSYEWSANGSVLGTGQTLRFVFPEACSGELLVLRVTGKDGSLGYATEWVSDPASLPVVYLDALPLGAIASTDGLGWYYYTFNGQLMDQSTNAAQIIDEALGNYSSVAVDNGAWNVDLGALPTNVIIKINGGVTGLTYTPSAGDYVIDESSGALWWNGVDDTYLLSNPYSSLITNATITALIASSTLNWAQISDANVTADQLIMSALASVSNLTSSQISDFNSAVDSLISYASISSSQISDFNSAVNSLITASSIAWSQVTNANATVVQLVTNSAITWSQITDANLTVQQLVGLYQNFNWQDSWNATVQQIIGNAAIAWNQVTGANATVNALITAASLSWSQISDANTNVNSLISTYMSTLSSLSVSGTGTFGNVVSTQPIGAYSYMIYVDPTNPSLYDAKAANGTICWSSTNQSLVIQNAANGLTVGRTCQESIMLTGNIGDVNNVTIHSYTKIIGVNAKITLPSGGTYVFMQGNEDITDVTIEGITFVSTAHTGNAIELYTYTGSVWRSVSNITIRDSSFSNFKIGIQALLNYSLVDNNRFTLCEQGLNIEGGFDSSVTNNYVCVPSACYGMYFIDFYRLSILGNHFWGTGTYDCTGLVLNGEVSTSTVSGNTFKTFAGDAIKIDLSGSRPPCFNIVVSGNSFDDVGNYHEQFSCISVGELSASHDILIEGNTAQNSRCLFTVGTNGQNIAANVTVIGNTLNVGWEGFRIYGNAYTVYLKDNVFTGLGSTPVIDASAGTRMLYATGNVGFVTENSGSSLNATATTFTITHGLAGTPTGVWCSFNTTQISSWTWTSTSSTITVTVVNSATADQIVACYWEAKYVP
jgi:hypothetical protein